MRSSNYLITKMSHGMTVKNKIWSLYVLSLNTNMSIFNLFKIKFLLPLGNTPVMYNIVWQCVGGKTGRKKKCLKIVICTSHKKVTQIISVMT